MHRRLGILAGNLRFDVYLQDIVSMMVGNQLLRIII